ncbi:hypothetical protein L226DRAFT_465266 [Lentinus tigrinus ALCF2SS1-7]|uniref:Uncharacterized protein n=1 Tax=Lentinus tigrinus ALCF2SS1-6 TaxID=1328759 RepID=A0A5C2S645_9APHY|nr:hypothetical protein L227DRAFT_549467 [Lentinus tigrinus ALCF2SS1-6]RPD73490.1 hypothetical protein L226DRAFT_465266 [Lentinus tigrinus ALCF2SS1-7]
MGDHAQPYIQAAIAAVKDQSLTPEEAANKVVEQCAQCVTSLSGNTTEVTQGGDTPGLESFLWSFWEHFVKIAQDDGSMHDRLARILAALKAKGSQGCDDWLVWGSPATWGDLSLFRPVTREEMNGPNPSLEGHGYYLDKSTPRTQAVLSGDLPANDPVERAFAQSRKEWLNMNTFLAKLWALDIVDEHFYGIVMMRTGLEPLSVQSTHGPSANVGSTETDDPPELGIEVAALWVKIAGAKMHACREILGPKGNPNWQANQGAPGSSGGTWDGVDGYHPDRWAHWKQLFSEVAQGNWRRNVTEAAQASVSRMHAQSSSAHTSSSLRLRWKLWRGLSVVLRLR